jgi:hypothetical protein
LCSVNSRSWGTVKASTESWESAEESNCAGFWIWFLFKSRSIVQKSSKILNCSQDSSVVPHGSHCQKRDFHPLQRCNLCSFSFPICVACEALTCSVQTAQGNDCARIFVHPIVSQDDLILHLLTGFRMSSPKQSRISLSKVRFSPVQLVWDTARGPLSTNNMSFMRHKRHLSAGWFGNLRSRAFDRHRHVRV